jgi:hypothetical protein
MADNETVREAMVREVVAAHSQEPITIEHLTQYFPADFELGEDDLEPHMPEPAAQDEFIAPPPPSALGDYLTANKPKEPTGVVTAPLTDFEPDEPEAGVSNTDFAVTLQDIEPAKPTRDLAAAFARLDPKNDKHWMPNGQPQLDMIRAFTGDRSITAAMIAASGFVRKKPAEPQKFTPEEVNAAVTRRIDSDQLVANARVDVLHAGNVERAAREKLAKAVTAFQTGLAPLTPEQLKKDYVKEQQAIRAGIASGEIPVKPRGAIGKSVVDRIASYGRGGSPAHGNYRRGAYAASARGRTIAPKVPSEV